MRKTKRQERIEAEYLGKRVTVLSELSGWPEDATGEVIQVDARHGGSMVVRVDLQFAEDGQREFDVKLGAIRSNAVHTASEIAEELRDQGYAVCGIEEVE